MISYKRQEDPVEESERESASSHPLSPSIFPSLSLFLARAAASYYHGEVCLDRGLAVAEKVLGESPAASASIFFR